MKEEYGSVGPIRFIDADSVKMYNCEGEEVAVPKCAKCGRHKQCFIGKEATAWVCVKGCKTD